MCFGCGRKFGLSIVGWRSQVDGSSALSYECVCERVRERKREKEREVEKI